LFSWLSYYVIRFSKGHAIAFCAEVLVYHLDIIMLFINLFPRHPERLRQGLRLVKDSDIENPRKKNIVCLVKFIILLHI
jgi:hypothetical protein